MDAQKKLEWVGKHVYKITASPVGRTFYYTIEYFDNNGLECEADGESFEEALYEAIGG